MEELLEPALKAERWEPEGASEFFDIVRERCGLLTGWGKDQLDFMHLSFQEYLTACELQRRAAASDPERNATMAELAGHYGESWWQEVLLLFLAMDSSHFRPLMREVVKRPAFAEHTELLGLLLEEAMEPDAESFVELLQQGSSQDEGLQRRQRAALEALQRMGTKEKLAEVAKVLGGHPSPEIQQWLRGRRVPGKVETTAKGRVELVFVPGGEFLMGSPPGESGRHENEGPQRRVKVSPFWLGRYPVTNKQYRRFLQENPHVEPPWFWGDRRFNQAQQPVVGVTWEQATAFARWAGGRLPTEAEWEYACRAGTTAARYDEDLDAIAWYGKNSGGSTHPVGEKKSNAWGLHDMLGNVWEWVGDWYGPYPAEPMKDPRGPDTGTARVVRGGSWLYSVPSWIRSAFRFKYEPGQSIGNAGFRCARGAQKHAHSRPNSSSLL